MSIHLTTTGLEQLLSDLKEQGYQGTRQHLEHLVMLASTASGLGLLHAGLEQLVLDRRFTAESIASFRQVMDFWSKRFHYATVSLNHHYRFDILFWKPANSAQVQESARFYLAMSTGEGEIYMKLRDQPKPERRTLRLEAISPAASVIEALPPMEASEPRATLDPEPAAWALALMDEYPAETDAYNGPTSDT